MSANRPGTVWPALSTAVQLDHVTHRYPNAAAPSLDDVSLTVQAGEFVYLVGASGSGKSSLLKLLYAQNRALSGTVHVAGQDITDLPERDVPALRRKIGVVFQNYQLLEHKSVADNVAFALHVTGRRKLAARRVPEALAMVGLEHAAARMPDQLSGGEQQRIAIARALAGRPTLLVADEPTGNLDPDTSAAIMKVLVTINRMGTTVLMATHDVELVNAYPRRVVRLDRGHIVRDDATGSHGSYHAVTPDSEVPA